MMVPRRQVWKKAGSLPSKICQGRSGSVRQGDIFCVVLPFHLSQNLRQSPVYNFSLVSALQRGIKARTCSTPRRTMSPPPLCGQSKVTAGPWNSGPTGGPSNRWQRPGRIRKWGGGPEPSPQGHQGSPGSSQKELREMLREKCQCPARKPLGACDIITEVP